MSDHSEEKSPHRRRNIQPRKELVIGDQFDTDSADSDTFDFGPEDPADFPVVRILKRLAHQGHRIIGSGPSWQAICPAHSDTNPSLSITETKEGIALVHCFGGCSVEEVFDSLGMKEASLYPSLYAQQFSKRQPQGYISFYGGKHGRITEEPGPRDDRKWQEKVTHLRSKRSLEILAKWVRLSPESLRAIHAACDVDREIGYFPEYNDRGEMMGLIRRDRVNAKRAMPGSIRGLTLVRYEDGPPRGPIYIAEGATDAAALYMSGVFAIGRSTAMSSAYERLWLVRHLKSLSRRQVVVLGDRDRTRAGERGAECLAQHLAFALDARVYWALPHYPFKDIREQVIAGRSMRDLELIEVQA